MKFACATTRRALAMRSHGVLAVWQFFLVFAVAAYDGDRLTTYAPHSLAAAGSTQSTLLLILLWVTPAAFLLAPHLVLQDLRRRRHRGVGLASRLAKI